jgi:hypothetical protein
MGIELTSALLTYWRQKAEAATSGPWSRAGLAALLRYARKNDGPWDDSEYLDCSLPLPEEQDADFITACSPAVVLALIARVEELETRMRIEITPALLDDLRRKAEAYTEDGEWEFSPAAGEIKTLTGDVIVQDSHAENKNMSFIAAANPAVVRVMLNEIDRLRQRYNDERLFSSSMIEHAAGLKKQLEELRQKPSNAVEVVTKVESKATSV